MTPARTPAPLKLASRVASRMMYGGAAPSEERLREAVQGRVVLVTGASFGIGEATARRLARAGATVLAVARSADRLEELAEDVAAQGGTVLAHPTDLTDPDAVDALAARVLEEHGHVDVLVSNAGKSIRRSIELSYERFHDFQRSIDINYLGPVKLVLALLPAMRERGQGHLVNVSTLGVRLTPAPRWAAYLASKSAFDVFVRSLAPEARSDGVDTTSIYMGLVHTRMSAPTAAFRAMPGLKPSQAAGIVCHAIVERPATIEPWWVPPAELAADAGRGPLDTAMGLYYRVSGDSPRARGDGEDEGGGGGRSRPSRPRTPSAVRGTAAYAGVGLGLLRGAARSGILNPVRPDRLVRMAGAVRRGTGPATASALAAARLPDHPALVDERGEVTFAELEARAGALAGALAAEHGVGPERALAVMCRNHRGFAEAMLAASRVGADLLALNTEFPGPQLAQALERQEVGAVVADEEFGERFDEAGYDGPRVVAWQDGDPGAADSLEDLIARGAPAPGAPARQGSIILLSSGTTGAPKAAPRSPSIRALIGPGATLLSTLPLRTREPLFVAPPLFHGFGLAYLGLGLALPCTIVVRRRFDAEATLAAIERHRVGSLAAVPVMLQRIMEVPAETRRRYDTSSLRMVVSAASPLSAALATAFMDEFGDILFNLYGSTETGFGAIAGPRDLRAAPGTVGRPPLGTSLRIVDADGAEVARGETGRVFVGGPMVFEGYAGGGTRETIDGRMSTGDLGHLDPDGRLFIDGREDDMIVSGGENVFPKEVEEVLAGHDDVADVAVIGVEDQQFGQRLRAFVVRRANVDVSADALKAYLKSNVARYKVPRDFVFVDELPRNPTGKVALAKLREG